MTVRMDRDGYQVFTGSRDHVIRGFEMQTPVQDGYTAKIELAPPHYDGVTSLVIHDNSLISASRDKVRQKQKSRPSLLSEMPERRP